MGNNLPIKQDNIIDKIKNWFKGIFAKKENVNNQIVSDEKLSNKERPQESFVNTMKAEFGSSNASYTNSEYTLNKKRNDEIEKILKNPEVLLGLPIEKLELLRDVCKEQANKYEAKLAKLKKENAS